VPELPDITVYVERLAARVVGEPLVKIRLGNPFILRTVKPSPKDLEGAVVRGVCRMGKRIVFELEGQRFVVLHLMKAGRLHWKDPGAKLGGRIGLAAFDFPKGALVFTEAGTKRRASLHLVGSRTELAALDPLGLEVMTADLAAFSAALRRENHTLKRTLTDPHVFSGIGNAYSDEIFWEARVSPVRLTQQMTDEQVQALYAATRSTLALWTDRLRKETGDGFPEKVTAFLDAMAVHGRFGKPCPRCGSAVQRIVYAENETNYCARCQTGGKLLADRALSRLLRGDWPKSIDEVEATRAAPPAGAPAGDAGAPAAKTAAKRRR
jgi:formamidopyrimidine-DNA glycosylase